MANQSSSSTYSESMLGSYKSKDDGSQKQSAKFWRARARASASERERAARSLARLKIKEEQLALARSRKNFDPFSSLARARSRTFFKASARELVQLASKSRKLAS